MVLQRILKRGIVQLKTKPSYHINMGLFLKTWNIQARKIMTLYAILPSFKIYVL